MYLIQRGSSTFCSKDIRHQPLHGLTDRSSVNLSLLSNENFLYLEERWESQASFFIAFFLFWGDTTLLSSVKPIRSMEIRSLAISQQKYSMTPKHPFIYFCFLKYMAKGDVPALFQEVSESQVQNCNY